MVKKSRSVAAFLSGSKDNPTVNELRSQVGRLERQIQKLRTKEELIFAAVDQVLGTAPPEIVVPAMPKRTGRGNEEIAILHLSDIQCGKVTKTYNTAVAEERMLLACQKAVYITDLRRSRAKIDEVHVYWGGDMVEGEDIFPHQAHEIDSPLYDQACVNMPRMLVKTTLFLLEHFKRVKVFSVAGNHGRNGPKHTRSSPRTNWDQVSYYTARALLLGTGDNPRKELEGRLEINMADDFYVVDRVFDWGNLIVHGHQITGGFAGFPWYGTAKKAWGWIDAIEVPWDNLFFGHFHTPAWATLGHRRFYANGTTESDNGFAKEQLAACGVPAQRLCFMDDRHGVISDDMLELVSRVPSSIRHNGKRRK